MYREEIDALNTVLVIEPGRGFAYLKLGVVYLKQGKRGFALRQYEGLRKFDEGMAQALKKEIDSSRN